MSQTRRPSVSAVIQCNEPRHDLACWGLCSLKGRFLDADDGMLDASKTQLHGDVHSCLHVAPPDYHTLSLS